jgi:hypothetical protein
MTLPQPNSPSSCHFIFLIVAIDSLSRDRYNFFNPPLPVWTITGIHHHPLLVSLPAVSAHPAAGSRYFFSVFYELYMLLIFMIYIFTNRFDSISPILKSRPPFQFTAAIFNTTATRFNIPLLFSIFFYCCHTHIIFFTSLIYTITIYMY